MAAIDERASWPAGLTEEVILDAVERRRMTLYDPGFCLACGFEQGGCEPDARRYKCELCGARQVYGIEEYLERLW